MIACTTIFVENSCPPDYPLQFSQKAVGIQQANFLHVPATNQFQESITVSRKTSVRRSRNHSRLVVRLAAQWAVLQSHRNSILQASRARWATHSLVLVELLHILSNEISS